jgi:queuine tRNA-ribosyltransferase
LRAPDPLGPHRPGLHPRRPHKPQERPFREDEGPLDPDCACPVCATWSRAYIHHLIRSSEILGAMLMTEHNVSFYQQMMAGLRAAIAERRLTAFADTFRARYKAASPNA